MKKIENLMGLMVLLITAIGTMITGEEYLQTQGENLESKGIIVIDPGHGGKDPGKVGCHDEVEKEINLAIALLVEEKLIKEGYEVTLTRKTDFTATGQYDSTKNEDMKARVTVISDANPACCVSIHQNSFTDSEVRGAQTFYYYGSVEGQRLAESIQKSLISIADPDNTRKVKGNTEYYLLKQSICPIVIVECGFLSNEDESLKLNSPEYQEILATAIVEGILEYLETER